MVAAAGVASNVVRHEIRAHDLFRCRENPLRAHYGHQIVFPFVFASDGVQPIGGDRDHFLIGPLAMVDELDAKSIFVTEQGRQFNMLLGCVKLDDPIPADMLIVDDGEAQAGQHVRKHQTRAKHGTGEHRP